MPESVARTMIRHVESTDYFTSRTEYIDGSGKIVYRAWPKSEGPVFTGGEHYRGVGKTDCEAATALCMAIGIEFS